MKMFLLSIFNPKFLQKFYGIISLFRRSKLLKKESNLGLYKIRRLGIKLWLDKNSYLQNKIINFGVWEKNSTKIIKKYLKPGDIFIDVGANIGYFTILASKIVGDNGRVLAYEPTKKYATQIKMNIKDNDKHNNISFFPYGLSDTSTQAVINIGNSSATLHKFGDLSENDIERIELKQFDTVFNKSSIDRIDFIKVDIDGHEPAFFKGAIKNIKKYKPKILLEVNQANYYKAGFDLTEFYNTIKGLNIYIYSENNLEEIKDINSFLLKCGNFTHSHNILLSFNKI